MNENKKYEQHKLN